MKGSINFHWVILLALAGLMLLFVTSCASQAPVTGAFYTNVQSNEGDKVLLNAQTALKQGEATCKSIMGAIAWGNCGVDMAMRDGGITKVHHVERIYTNIFFFFAKYTVTVFGE